MKIEYRQPVGTGTWTVLADEAFTGSGSTLDKITGYKPHLTSSPSITPLYGQGRALVQDLGGGKWEISFGVHRVHGTAANALKFLVIHGTIFDASDPLGIGGLGNMDLRITVDSQIVYVQAAALQSFEPDEHSDQSTFCKYSFVSGGYELTPS